MTTDAELARAAACWGDVVGLDTEFQRTNTFYPLPGLYQVVSDGRVYLIDPLSVDDWTPLVEMLEDGNRTLVMHACMEDLELMTHHFGATPRRLFDTQLAHAFVSTDFSLSYSNLVLRHMGVTLGKPQTRSDWRRRPLSDAQVHYACEDVAHLLALHERLSESLDSLGRSGWFQETMLDHGRFQPSDPEAYYLGMRGAWRLNGEDLAVLQALASWRERTAMTENVPRNRVVWDEHLLAFARLRTLEESSLRESLPQPVARRYGEALMAAHRAGREAPSVERLEPPLSQHQGRISRKLREIGRREAERHGLSQELLARKRDVEACIRHYAEKAELSAAYTGWRGELVGEEFRRVLAEMS